MMILDRAVLRTFLRLWPRYILAGQTQKAFVDHAQAAAIWGVWGYIFAYHTAAPTGPLEHKEAFEEGKEDVNRVTERYGIPTHPRPEGPLIWLHAVGLGEVMALRGMIPILSQHCPDAHFGDIRHAQSADVFSQTYLNAPCTNICH